MKKNTKAKWVVGISGAAFTAFMLSQLDSGAQTDSQMAEVNITDSMSVRERELIKLDWSDFTIQENVNVGNTENDRTTRRSR